MPDITPTQARDKIWAAVIQVNNTGGGQTLQFISGENVVEVTITRTSLNMDRVV